MDARLVRKRLRRPKDHETHREVVENEFDVAESTVSNPSHQKVVLGS